MSGKLKDFDLIGAQRFLSALPRSALERGRLLLLRDKVSGIQELDESVHYQGMILADKSIQVELLYLVHGWKAFCELDGEGARCEHAAALMQRLISDYNSEQVQRLSSMHSGQQAVAVSRALANQEVASVLAPRLVAARGRPLKAVEANYLQRIHRSYNRFVKTKSFNSWDFEDLGFRAAYGQMHIWPSPPRDEYQFWLYIARAAQAARFEVPDFMLPITDFSGIEEELKAWERQKEVDLWKNMLATFHFEHPVPAESQEEQVELRMVISPEDLRLQWKHPGDLGFSWLRKTQYRELMYGGRRPVFSLEGELIWSRLHSHLGYEGRVDWRTIPLAALKALRSLLNTPAIQHAIVNAEGTPLLHLHNVLAWKLTPPGDPAGDYALQLVRTDGEPLPEILAALPGTPTLYLAANAVLTGPRTASGVLSPDKPNRIPAKALESEAGIALLQNLGIALPEPLQSKVVTIPLKLVISCKLTPIYHGSKTEDCIFQTRAAGTDGLVLEWLGSSWAKISASRRTASGVVQVHDKTDLELVPQLLAGLGLKDTPNGPALRVNKTFPEKFAAWLKTVPARVEVRLQGDLASFGSDAVAGRVKLEVQETVIDWFDLSVLVDVNDTTLTQAEIRLLLNAKGGFVRLAGKGWKRLQFDLTAEEDERLAQLGLSPRELSAEPQRLHTLQLANKAAEKFLAPGQVQQLHRRAAEIKARVAPEVPGGITADLRAYQRDGYHFLAYLSANHFGGILADDMGLGKTLQTLAWLLHLREQKLAEGAPAADPTLVVCPKSVMDNWQAEAQRFASSLRVRIWPAGELPAFKQEIGSADIHVLNYNQLRSLGESLIAINWLAVVLDEGQYIKNPSSQTAQIARTLRAQNRLILTGTPIENRLMDLWSLMSFAMPGVLGSRAQFGKLYDSKEDPFARQRLSARVRPFLLRRTKNQVAKDLPDRIEEDLFCEIEGEQLTLYRAELKNAQRRLLGITTQKELAEQRFHFLTSLLRLRQICCHPKLVNENSTAPGAKLEALLEHLEPLMAEGQKVLVFSQFVELLNLVRPLLLERNWKTFYLAGETENRGALVKEFQASEEPSVFLISLKAGGFGLNLTAASYVVLFDPWWNPAVENQAIDRTHRIGQANKVIAYRLLIKNSIEEKIRALQRSKKALSEEILGEEKFSQGLTLEDLQFLLED